MSEAASATPATPPNQRVDVVLRHEMPEARPAPAAQPASRRADTAPAPAPEAEHEPPLRIGSKDEFRQMTVAQFTERLAEESMRGARRTLRQMGIPKTQRDEILASVAEKKGSFTVVKGEELQSLRTAHVELEKVKPTVGQLAEYEKLLGAVADERYATLPEAAQKQLVKRLPKEATARDRLSAIDEYKALLAELKADLTASEKPADGAKPAEAAPAATAKPAEAAPAAPAPAADKKPNPSSTGAPPGPSTPKNTLNALEQWEDINKRSASMAAIFYNKNQREIETLRRARGAQ